MRRVSEVGGTQGARYDGKSHFFENDQGECWLASLAFQKPRAVILQDKWKALCAFTYKDAASLEDLEQLS